MSSDQPQQLDKVESPRQNTKVLYIYDLYSNSIFFSFPLDQNTDMDDMKKQIIEKFNLSKTFSICFKYFTNGKDVAIVPFDQIKELALRSPDNELPLRLADYNLEKEIDMNKDDNDINHPKWDNDRYFDEYAKMYIHYEMIRDKTRCNAYRDAILQNRVDFEDKVVLDLGCGTGILSIFCVEAGAKKVYAVDASDIANYARQIVEMNGHSDKIEVIKGKMEEIILPEKVDVIVSEWMGLFLLFESMLESVLFARNKWLKEGGKLYPSRARLHIAPIANDEYREKMEFFSTPKYGINMTSLVSTTRYEFSYYCNRAQQILPEWLCCDDQVFFEADIRTIDKSQIRVVESNLKFSKFRRDYINGFGTWFDVTFDGPTTTVNLTTSPFTTLTHWKQDMFLFEDIIPIKNPDTDEINGKILAKQGEWIRHYDVTISFSFTNGIKYQKRWNM